MAQVERLKTTLDLYDFTPIKERLIISVPGRHKAEEKFKFGHLSMRLKLKSVQDTEKDDYFLAQISSIGSLSGVRNLIFLF